MAVIREKLNKGVNYKVTLTTDKDTDGETIEIIAYPIDKPNDSGTVIGTATGKPKNREIEFTLQTSSLDGETFVVEAWINKDSELDKFLIYPEENDTFFIDFVDRRLT